MGAMVFKDGRCDSQQLRAQAGKLLNSTFDSLCWLYFFRDVRALDSIVSDPRMREEAKERIAGAIEEAEQALTAAGIDLAACAFVEKSHVAPSDSESSEPAEAQTKSRAKREKIAA